MSGRSTNSISHFDTLDFIFIILSVDKLIELIDVHMLMSDLALTDERRGDTKAPGSLRYMHYNVGLKQSVIIYINIYKSFVRLLLFIQRHEVTTYSPAASRITRSNTAALYQSKAPIK